MKLETVTHKLYAKHLATNCDITTGNVYSNAQASSCVRAWNDTSPDYKGNPRRPGELQEFDLKPLILPPPLKFIVKHHLRHKSGTVYLLRHYAQSRSKERIMHGFIITTDHDNTVVYSVAGNSRKSQEIVTYAKAQIWRQAIRSNTARAKHAYTTVSNPFTYVLPTIKA